MKRVFAVLFAALLLCGIMLTPVMATSDEYVTTDKEEYVEGEMIHMSYSFAAKDSERQIYVYRDSIAEENLVWVISATGKTNSGYHVLFWPENTLATPGNYIMKVVKKGGGDYGKDITSTFTVKENPDLDRNPSISMEETEVLLDGTLTFNYSGITDAIGWNSYPLKVVLYDEDDFELEQWNLWDGSEWAGVSGTIEYECAELWQGDFYLSLVSEDPNLDLSEARVDFSIVDEVETATPSATPEATEESTPTPTPTVTSTDDGTDTDNGDSTPWIIVGIVAALVVVVGAVVVVIVFKKKKK